MPATAYDAVPPGLDEYVSDKWDILTCVGKEALGVLFVGGGGLVAFLGP